MSSLLETQDGQLGIIQCVVESDPQADLSLFKGGELVASACGCHSKARHRARVTPSHNSLKMEIQDVVLEDEGTYMCQAINTYGNSSVSMDFTAESECMERPEGQRLPDQRLRPWAIPLHWQYRTAQAAPEFIFWIARERRAHFNK